MRRRLPVTFSILWIALLALVIAEGTSAQNNDSLQDGALQSILAQDQVQKEAETIMAGLSSIRQQMLVLMPNDTARVDAAIKKLEALNKDQMSASVSALKGAGQIKDPKQRSEKIMAALKDQSLVEQQLRQLAFDLQARENVSNIAGDIQELMRRETSIWLESRRLGKVRPSPGELHGKHQQRFDFINEDQKVVASDIKLLSRKVQALSKESGGETKNPLVKADSVMTSKKIQETADHAAELTQSGPFKEATDLQLSLIAALLEMKDALSDENNPLDRYHSVSSRLQEAAGSQKEVVDVVMPIGQRQDIDTRYKVLESHLGDDVGLAWLEIQKVNTQASSKLEAALDSIDKALLNFSRMWEEHDDAKLNVQNAFANIQEAIKSVDEQIKVAEKFSPKTPEELAKLLDDLQKEVAQAASEQSFAAALPTTPPVPQRQALQAKVSGFQQRAVPIDPTVAEMLGDAAKLLPQDSKEAQQGAAKKLSEAASALLKAKNQAIALAASQAKLATAQQSIDKAQQELQNNQTSQAANDLKAAQNAAQEAQQAAQNASPEAAQALSQAAQALEKGAQASAEMKAGEAQADSQTASNALAQAQEALQQSGAQMPGGQAMAVGAGTQASDNPQGSGKNPDSKGNGSGGPTGDNLQGAGEQGSKAEILDALNTKERDAVSLLKREPIPRDFVAEVQQYYKNIADGAGLKP